MSAISRDKKAKSLHFTGVSLFRLNFYEFINYFSQLEENCAKYCYTLRKVK